MVVAAAGERALWRCQGEGVHEGWMKSEEWGTRIRDGWLGWCCGVSRGAQEDDGGSRRIQGIGWRAEAEQGWSGWLVGDALRELPAARSRDSYPRPIIDRSPEERRTHCTHRALYLAPYHFSEGNPQSQREIERSEVRWTVDVSVSDTSKRRPGAL